MNIFYHDPGPCPVDDAPHTTCTSADYKPIVISQLPMHDAMVREQRAVEQLAQAQNAGQGLAPAQVTTATYRRQKGTTPGR